MGRAGSFSRRVAALVTCAVAFGIASSLLSGSESGLAKLDPVLQQRASTLHGTTRVIIRARDARALPLLQPLIEQAGGRAGRLLSIVNSRAATLPNAALATVASSGLVGRISIDRVIAGAVERTSGATGAAAVRQQFGYDGAGIGVAVIDSGVSSWHDDLADASGGVQRVDRFVDFVNGRTSPYDDHGHGTHVAGIIAGNGFDSGGARTGIAPAARLIVLKVLDSAGRGRISDVIAALGYVVEHKDALGIRVVNLSVAAQVFESYNTDPLTLAARAPRSRPRRRQRCPGRRRRGRQASAGRCCTTRRPARRPTG